MRSRLVVTLALVAWVCGSVCGCGERPTPSHPSDSRGVGAASDGGSEAEGAPNPMESLPTDVPIPEGLQATSVSSQEPGSLVALFTGDLEPEEVVRVFGEGLRGQGWAIDDSQSKGSDLGLFARKNERIASVVATRLSGKLHVELGLWSPKE